MRIGIAQGQNIIGCIIDEQSKPMPFANVVLINRADSAFVSGAVTKDDGTFIINTDKQDGLLKVSSVGYVIRYVDAKQGNVGDIVMQPDTQMLREVTVKGSIPTHKLTAEGLQTNVENTILSKLGTANDVLAHIPGLQKNGDDYSVFGKKIGEH